MTLKHTAHYAWFGQLAVICSGQFRGTVTTFDESVGHLYRYFIHRYYYTNINSKDITHTDITITDITITDIKTNHIKEGSLEAVTLLEALIVLFKSLLYEPLSEVQF